MAQKNRINTTISEENMEIVNRSIDAIEVALSFLLVLDKQERKELLKMGDGSAAFVNNATKLAQINASFMPRKFNVEELVNDTTLFNQLSTIGRRLGQLQIKVDDTRRVAGSESYAGSLSVYKYAKDADVDEALEPYVDDLARRFVRKSAGAPSEETPTGASDGSSDA